MPQWAEGLGGLQSANVLPAPLPALYRRLWPVVHVLFFSDRQVRDKLFALVDGTRGLLLVKGVRHGKLVFTPKEPTSER